MTEERHEQDVPQLRGQQHGHVVDVRRMRGRAVSWTLRPQRTRMIRQGHKQTHEAALRASRYVRRHAWQFHGAGVADAVRDLQRICGWNPTDATLDCDWSPDCGVHGPSLTAKCVCTHPYSSHNANGLCIALPGVLGCGCMGWSEKRPVVAPAECPDCSHAHVADQLCTVVMPSLRICGCTG